MWTFCVSFSIPVCSRRGQLEMADLSSQPQFRLSASPDVADTRRGPVGHVLGPEGVSCGDGPFDRTRCAHVSTEGQPGTT